MAIVEKYLVFPEKCDGEVWWLLWKYHPILNRIKWFLSFAIDRKFCQISFVLHQIYIYFNILLSKSDKILLKVY